MKKSLLNLLLLISLVPTLSSCSNENKVIVMNSLDVMSGSALKTSALNGRQLITMFDTKQSFVLYVKSTSCQVCQTVNPYFTTLANETKYVYNSYNITEDPYFIDVYKAYPDYVSETPKTIFFKNGEPKIILSNNKYKNESLFISSMNEFTTKSNMYSANSSTAIDYFYNILNFSEYIVYIMDYTNKESYSYFSTITYPVLSISEKPSLIVDASILGEANYKTLLDRYDINDSTITNYLIDVKGDDVSYNNYLKNQND
jgi:thiol-disulfide isomerase/thioredoxin